MTEPQIPIDREQIAAFCQKWKIAEFSLFGSVLTSDFRPDSDVDVMVEFAPDARIGMWDLYDIEEELRTMFGREVDVVTRRSLIRSENYLMRNSIIAGARTVYAG